MRKLSSYIIGIGIGAIGFDDHSIVLRDIVQREVEVTLGIVGAAYASNRIFAKEYVDPASISLGVLTGRIFSRCYF